MNSPFQQLLRSHRRLSERLDELRSIADSATRGPVDVDGLEAIAGFFSRAVRRHEADEELSLFPRLRERPELAPLLDRLLLEHGAHERLHAELERFVEILRTDAKSAVVSDLVRIADDLANAYGAHLAIEERDLFPAAERALDARALAEMTTEMESRRGR